MKYGPGVQHGVKLSTPYGLQLINILQLLCETYLYQVKKVYLWDGYVYCGLELQD